MSEANDQTSKAPNWNVLVIAVTVIVLAVILLFFRGRGQDRELQLQQLENNTNVWEEWGPTPNKQPADAQRLEGGKVL